jgi:hypothetical protein
MTEREFERACYDAVEEAGWSCRAGWVDRLKEVVKETGGRFDPEPVVVWECDPEGAAAGWRLLSNGEWLARGDVSMPWVRPAAVGPHLRELARLKLMQEAR